MFRLLAVVALLAVGAFASLESDFDFWTRQYDRVYASETEHTYRLAVYMDNARRVQLLNDQSNGGAVFSLNNQFADLTSAEFKNQYLGSVQPNTTEKVYSSLDIDSEQAVPDTYSWVAKDKVTPVKNQGQCGSCWAFSATENIESVWMIAKGLTPATFQPLAPQQIVDCDKTDGGCNGGWPYNAYNYVKGAGGMDTETSYPYHAVNQACQFKPADVEVRITGWKYATTTKNEQEMKTATATVAPLSVCVDAQPWQFYSSGVMTAAQCGTSIDHCVQIVGYDTSVNPPYWEVRNSWGTGWGEKGFIRLQFGTNTCAVAEVVTTVTV